MVAEMISPQFASRDEFVKSIPITLMKVERKNKQDRP